MPLFQEIRPEIQPFGSSKCGSQTFHPVIAGKTIAHDFPHPALSHRKNPVKDAETIFSAFLGSVIHHGPESRHYTPFSVVDKGQIPFDRTEMIFPMESIFPLICLSSYGNTISK
jgi:hypothetical protein